VDGSPHVIRNSNHSMALRCRERAPSTTSKAIMLKVRIPFPQCLESGHDCAVPQHVPRGARAAIDQVRRIGVLTEADQSVCSHVPHGLT
jgi:hypothetical protein